MVQTENPPEFDHVSFAEMLNTRFCHDLAGPVSAVYNGLDFLADDSVPEMQEQAFELLRMSASEVLSKLQTYRLAYGRVARGGVSSVEEVRDVVTRYFLHDKVELDWPEQSEFGVKIDNEIRRLLVNMVTNVARELVYGGTLTVRKEIDGDTKRIVVKGEAEKLKQNEVVQAIINGTAPEEDEMNPITIPAYFMVEVAKMRGVTLRYDLTETSLTFSAEYV